MLRGKATALARGFFVLAATVSCSALQAQSDRDVDENDADIEVESEAPTTVEAAAAGSGVGARITQLISQSEGARRRGDLQGQIAVLREANAVANGRNSAVVNLLASAVILAGARDEARRLREQILTTDLRPAEKLSHATTLAVYAAEEGDFANAQAWLARSEAIYRELGPEDSRELAQTRLHWTRNSVLLVQGKYRESEAEGRLAAASVRKLIEAGGEKATAQLRYWQNQIDAKFARALVRQGKLAESEWHYRDALERSMRDTGANSVHSAKFALELANLQLRQGRHEAALRRASAALAALESQGMRDSTYNTSQALLLIGWSQVMGGRFDEAIRSFERRARASKSGGGSVVWGYAMIRAGRAEAALPMLRAHYQAGLRRSATSYLTRERAAMLAYALQRAGRHAEAVELFASAVPGLVRSRQGRRAADRADILVETISNWIIEGYLELLSRDAQAGSARAIAEAFRLADIARGSSVQRALALASTRARIDDPELAQMARSEQDLGNRHAALTRLVEDLLSRPRAKQSQGLIDQMRRDSEAALAQREALRTEIAERFPKYSQLIEPRPPAINDLRKLLKPGEVLLSTFVAPDRTYVWAVPASGASRFAVASLGAGDIDDAVRKLRSALDVGDVPLLRFPAYDTATAYALYERLLKPLEAVWNSASALLVVPHGALGQLPFALLPTTAPGNVHGPDFAGYRKVSWLIRKLAISQLPSVSALAALRSGESADAPPSIAFAGFGDPQFSADAPAAASTRRGLPLRNLGKTEAGDPGRPPSPLGISKLPPLPDTAQELKEIAAILEPGGADVMLGRDATETNVKRRDLARYRVLMFATHGLVPGELDGLMQPALALSNPEITGERDADGLLTLDEVLGLKLAADWVVLSACNTASSDGAGDEAVSGLGRAFFYAGAKALLVSNWPVETVSARLITTDLFRRQSREPSLTRGEALRRTLLDMIDRGEARDDAGKLLYNYAHPMFWAPFSLVGDGAR